MKKILLLFVITYYCIPAFSQTLTEGYIVKNSGDTVRGFIRDRVEWYQPQVEFATTASSGLERIPLSEINVFYLQNYDAYYYVRILEIDKKPVANGKLDPFPGRTIVKDTIALRLLVKGAINFYDYTDENFKQHFFVQKNNGTIDELAYVRYMSSGAQIAEMPYFVEPLKRMISDCDKVSMRNIRYDQKVLTKTVQQYNSCFGTSEQYGTKKEHAKLNLGVFAGSGISNMGFKDDRHALGADPAGATWPTTTSVLGGIRLELIPGREAIRVIPIVDITYQKTGDSKTTRHLNTAEDNLMMNFNFIDLDLSIKYLVVKTPGINVYLKGTAGIAYIAGATTSYSRTDLLLQRTTGPQSFATYNKLGFDYGGAAGVSYKRFWFELNYKKNIAPVHSANANGLCTTFYATLGFRLTKN